jgi:hypothetical protein
MILLEKRAAIKAFYYLMAVDGAVTTDEIECFNSIGTELDQEAFVSYRDDLIAECELQLKNIIDEEDYYEVVLEGTDKALAAQIDDPTKGVSIRLMVWDMLVIAFSNADYSSFERKFIKHIVRVMDMDRSVFLEMEQIIKTNAAIENELRWINQSNRSYSEIRPVVDELERRQKVVLTCARQLIEDELYSPVEKIALPGTGLYTGAIEMFSKVGGTVSVWGKKTAEATKTVTGNIGKQTKGLIGGKKGLKSPETINADTETSDTAE